MVRLEFCDRTTARVEDSVGACSYASIHGSRRVQGELLASCDTLHVICALIVGPGIRIDLLSEAVCLWEIAGILVNWLELILRLSLS